MVSCPDCHLVLQSLDLPCPACGPAAEPIDVDWWTLHEYSRSFAVRHRFRPDADAFVERLNAWLGAQPGLVHVTPDIDFDGRGVARGATLTCLASSRPAVAGFRLHRLTVRPRSSTVRALDVGAALNRWGDAHPDQTRVWHQVLRCYGTPVECWLLAEGLFVPAFGAQEPDEFESNGNGHRRSRRGG